MIVASIEAENVPESLLELAAPDTVVISQPHREAIGSGTYTKIATWFVDHVQPGASVLVEITVSAGELIQIGLCRVSE